MDDLIGAMEDVDLNSLQEDGLGPVSSVPINTKQQEVKSQADSLGDGGSSNNNKSFVVLDLKATCWDTVESRDRRLKPEIVEFSSVLVDAATGHTESRFHEYVIPTENHLLSEYCKNYHGIKQEDVDRNNAMYLDKALEEHQAWIGRLTNGNSAAAVVVTWGNWDCRNMLSQECFRKNLVVPDYFHRWINLRIPFVDKYGNGYGATGLREALEATGLKWEGAIKGGESHAHNKARLLSWLIQQGANLAITSWLDRPAAAPSPAIPGRGGHDAGHPSSTPGMDGHGGFGGQQHGNAMPLDWLKQITNNFSEKLGRGTFGTVYKGVLNNGKEVAVKLLHPIAEGFESEELQFSKELENLKRLNHPNIVQLLGYCYVTEKQYVEHNGRTVVADKITRALFLEYMPKTSLQGYLDDESVDWQTRYKIILGTCEGLQYLHRGLENAMLHLDLKPRNILLDQNMEPKLADFGLSKLIYDSKTQTASKFIGTRRYCPPEYFKGLHFSRKFDIFSLGVVMIEIIAGTEGYNQTDEIPSHEFIDQVQENWIKKIHQAATDCASQKCGCRQVKTCIEIALECVHRNRKQRPHIEDILSRLKETEHNTEKSSTTASSQNEK